MNNRLRITPSTIAAAGVLGSFLVAAPAWAADCSTLPNPVYVAGSSAAKPFLAKVAGELASLGSPVTLVYQGQGSCVGVNYLAALPAGTITGTGVIWDTAGAEVAGGCTLSLTGDAVNIGISDVYATSCPGVTALPAGVHDFYGPVQSMTFSVPVASTQQSISAEAAYLMFGLGAAGEVPTWNDPAYYMVRSETSGTQQMIAAAITVPANQWLGTSNAKSGDVLNGLVAASAGGHADAAVGILSTDVLDKNRDKVRALAYQHFDQTCGYHPDSEVAAFDKQNVRDGHYMIWGPLHLLTEVDASNVPLNADAKLVIDYLTGAVVPTSFDLIALEATSGVVPTCAMRVTRDSEIGPLASYQPEKSCECKFVASATGAAPADCQTCAADSECPTSAPACNYGFCEVQ
jgi:ABC-type phosphate transport system substrate-binding protein